MRGTGKQWIKKNDQVTTQATKELFTRRAQLEEHKNIPNKESQAKKESENGTGPSVTPAETTTDTTG